ncbi:MAG: amidohydrolase family protein, partial [Chloroflexi bacterium]|nr:amidohydrolase family protein [Chloroflexota bacterium]
RLIRRLGVERVLFGSDAPGADQQPQVLQLLRSGLSDRELDQVLVENARPVLGLS